MAHLKKEGMLTVSASTKNKQPLVIANLLTTDGSDGVSEVVTEEGDGYVSGLTSGKKFAFSTQPGKIYQVDGKETDAAAITWSNDRIFLALSTTFKSNDGSMAISSSVPLSLEISIDGIKYGSNAPAKLIISSAVKPKIVLLNGKAISNFTFDSVNKQVSIQIQAGEGLIKVN